MKSHSIHIRSSVKYVTKPAVISLQNVSDVVVITRIFSKNLNTETVKCIAKYDLKIKKI